MIIAAYAGTGKTTFAETTSGAIDVPSMPYSWILPETDGREGGKLEGEKGALYHLRNPLFPENYAVEILKAERLYHYVLIPTNIFVIRCLQEEFGRRVLLCYPESGLREEYRERFVRRGNSESFLSLFVDGWDGFLELVRENKAGIHILLKSGMYLSDLKDRFDAERTGDHTSPVPLERIAESERKLREQETELALYMSGDEGSCMYSISDLSDPAEKQFLYQIGRLIYENTELISLVAPTQMLKKGNTARRTWTDSREQAMEFVKRHMDNLPGHAGEVANGETRSDSLF